MALWTIGDLHLSFGVKGPIYVMDSSWKGHEKKIDKYCRKWIHDQDTLVITGDHTWGKSPEERKPDFEFIEDLPGRKILLKGNHDMFWDAKKTEKLNQAFDGRLYFLQNNFYSYEDYALVGTKGYCYEGLDSIEHYQKIMDREEKRLRTSFELAKNAGFHKFIVFLHYPPTTIGEQESVFTRMAEEYGASFVIYSHSHGQARFHDSIQGPYHGIEYRLVSSDFLKFRPVRILD